MLELLTTAQMAEADRRTIAAGTASIALMESAGRAVADTACRLLQGRSVLVVAGPGNNGGDGFVAARILAERGHSTRVVFTGEKSRLKGDAARAADRWQGRIEQASPEAITEYELVIDALFGAGLDRKVEGLPLAMIAAINRVGAPVLAVDLPSGINGTTGAIMGNAVVATHTVTFFRRKTGHLLLPGRMHCGVVEVADIGIPESVLREITPSVFANRTELWGSRFPRPRPQDHKYARGHAVVVSGGLSNTGAARLAARGALRAGAGLVTLASPREALSVNATANLAVMVRPVDGAAELGEFLADKRRNAVVLGPGAGVGRSLRQQVQAALASEAAIVLDADALSSFAGSSEKLTTWVAGHRGGAVVLTPHQGEFSRLFNEIEEDSKFKSKLEKALLAARKNGAIVLYKGGDTVVAAPDGRATISDNAPAHLATAGSGDVLSGLIAGLLAQGMPGFEAASSAVWLHGEAARQVGPGLIAEDLPEAIPAVYRRLLSHLEIGPQI